LLEVKLGYLAGLRVVGVRKTFIEETNGHRYIEFALDNIPLVRIDGSIR
jgi:hypothetical protein